MQESPIEYNVVLAGNTEVGKSNLFCKLTKGEFFEKKITTIGFDRRYLSIEIEVNQNDKMVNKEINITLTDFACTKRFWNISKNFFRNSDGILLLYDVTNKESFKYIENFIENIHESLGNHENSNIIILIGNKVDLLEFEGYERQVNEDEAKALCEEKSLIWGGEISVKRIELSQLKNLFKNYVKHIYDKVSEKKMYDYKIEKKHFCFLG